MQHAPPKNTGRHTCHTQWSFHLKCGEDHDGYRQILGAPKGSLGSHLGLRDLVHVGHCVLDSQRFKFLGDAFPIVALAGLGEPDDSRYVFLATYRGAKTFGH